MGTRVQGRGRQRRTQRGLGDGEVFAGCSRALGRLPRFLPMSCLLGCLRRKEDEESLYTLRDVPEPSVLEETANTDDAFIPVERDARNPKARTTQVADASCGIVKIDLAKTYQEIHGFGGSVAFFSDLICKHPSKEKVLEAMFKDLRPSVLRMRNWFDQSTDDCTSSEMMQFDCEVVQASREYSETDSPSLMMASWSPPQSMVCRPTSDDGDFGTVLKKDETGRFLYQDFAERYWLKALLAYKELGVEPRWISIQNEPDYETREHETCLFDTMESEYYPSYFRALKTVHEVLQKEMENCPELVGPDCFDLTGYALWPNFSSCQIDSHCGHLYSAGQSMSDPFFFSKLEKLLGEMRKNVLRGGSKHLWVTEFCNMHGHRPEDPLLLALTILTCLTKGSVSMYLVHDLAWRRGLDMGSMLIIEDPDLGPNGWSSEAGFYRTQSFHWFKHFTRFARPGMLRCRVSASPTLPGIESVALVGSNKEFSVITVNTRSRPAAVIFSGLPTGVGPNPLRMYVSTLYEGFREVIDHKALDATVLLEPMSITTWSNVE